jgi:integrase
MMQEDSTPPELREKAAAIRESALPRKSMGRYQKEYAKFEKWLEEKNVKKISENTVMAYFEYLANEKKNAGSTLMTKYSELHQVLLIEKKMDISTFGALTSFLGHKKKDHVPKQAPGFTRQQVDDYLRTANNEHDLHRKLIFAFGVIGAVRKKELYRMTLDSVVDLGSANGLEVRIPHGLKTGTRDFRILPNTTDPALDIPALYRLYVSRRPSPCPPNLFLRYENGKCARMVCGENWIGDVTKEVAAALGIEDPAKHTSHGMRRTGSTLVVEGSASAIELQRHGGWTNGKVPELYVTRSEPQKRKMAEMAQGITASANTTVTVHSSPVKRAINSINIQNCGNVYVYMVPPAAAGGLPLQPMNASSEAPKCNENQ